MFIHDPTSEFRTTLNRFSLSISKDFSQETLLLPVANQFTSNRLTAAKSTDTHDWFPSGTGTIHQDFFGNQDESKMEQPLLIQKNLYNFESNSFWCPYVSSTEKYHLQVCRQTQSSNSTYYRIPNFSLC